MGSAVLGQMMRANAPGEDVRARTTSGENVAGRARGKKEGRKNRGARAAPGVSTSSKAQKPTRESKTKEQKVCVNCRSVDTPYWRKDKDGVGSLCNACGLYLAKNAAPRPALLWRRDSATSGSEDNLRNAAPTTPAESEDTGVMPGNEANKHEQSQSPPSGE